MEKKTSELIEEMKDDSAYHIKQYVDEHSEVYVNVYGKGNEKTYNWKINYVYMWVDSDGKPCIKLSTHDANLGGVSIEIGEELRDSIVKRLDEIKNLSEYMKIKDIKDKLYNDC